jgi:hypothetical protein
MTTVMGGEGGRHEQMPRNQQQPSTCPQPCEPLLTGWIAGANSYVTTYNRRKNKKHQTSNIKHQTMNDEHRTMNMEHGTMKNDKCQMSNKNLPSCKMRGRVLFH